MGSPNQTKPNPFSFLSAAGFLDQPLCPCPPGGCEDSCCQCAVSESFPGIPGHWIFHPDRRPAGGQCHWHGFLTSFGNTHWQLGLFSMLCFPWDPPNVFVGCGLFLQDNPWIAGGVLSAINSTGLFWHPLRNYTWTFGPRHLGMPALKLLIIQQTLIKITHMGTNLTLPHEQ